MGRLAQNFAGLTVVDMIPYNMPSTLTMTASTQGVAFPNTDLLNTVDKPFAVHRVIPRILALDSTGLVLSTQPDVEVREALISLRMVLTGFNQDATKAVVPIGNLLQGTTSQRAWSFEEPFVLPNSYGVQVFADCAAFPAAFAGAGVVSLQVRLNLQGYLLVVAPPRG